MSVQCQDFRIKVQFFKKADGLDWLAEKDGKPRLCSVRVEVDMTRIASLLGATAVKSKVGKATYLHGAVKVTRLYTPK